jgi:hypothetical protein
VVPLLMIGGVYLCYEGFEKLAHRLSGHHARDDARRAELSLRRSHSAASLASAEQARIRGAVRTDFVLSAEIIVITLSAVAGAPFGTRVAVLVSISLLMTAGVYGLVAGIIKLDDAGLYLCRRDGDTTLARARRRIGATILTTAPLIMKALSVVGTAAMFLVGGGILAAGIPVLHDWIQGLAGRIAAGAGIGRVLRPAIVLALDAVAGIVAGALVLAVVSGVRRVSRARAARP